MIFAGLVLAQQQGAASGTGFGPQGQGWFCPWSGQNMRQGMMQQRGMGPGRMHGGQGMGPCVTNNHWGRGQYGPNTGTQQMQPLDQKTAQELAQNYVAGNPNLKIGQVTEKEGVYEAPVVTQDGSLVETLLIDKQTGWMKRVF
jgi:hypothetical protein